MDQESVPIKMREAGVFAVPAVDRDAWTIGLMTQVVSDARNARGKILPWYQRPFALLALHILWNSR